MVLLEGFVIEKPQRCTNTVYCSPVLLLVLQQIKQIIVHFVTADFVRQNKTGLVANKKNFAKKIQTLLTSKRMRKRFIRNGLETAKNYDIKKCTDDLIKVYTSLKKNN